MRRKQRRKESDTAAAVRGSKRNRISWQAGRCRRRGGECESGDERALAEKLFVWTAEAVVRSQVVVVDGGNVPPEEAGEGESDGGH